MARPLRILVAGGIYHVVSRGNSRATIFVDEEDRRHFFDCMAAVALEFDVRCHAYCLMGNHYHLLLETRRANLSHAMRQLNGVYSQRFNQRRGRMGHVLQGRYSATLVDKDPYLLEACRYIVLNPVRAGLVQRAEEWRWSSHRAFMGLEATPPFLCTEWILDMIDPRGAATARVAYAGFIDDAPPRPDLVDELRRAVPLLGSDTFVQTHRPGRSVKTSRSIPKAQRHAGRPGLATLFDSCETSGERDRAVRVAVLEHGYTQVEIAQHLGLHPVTVHSIVRAEKPAERTLRFET